MLNRTITGAFRSLAALLLVLSVVVVAPVAAQPAEKSPHQVVEETTRQLMNVVRNNEELLATQPDAYYDKVKAVLKPVVDFGYIARGVMGRQYWQQATEEQRRRFAQVFRDSLVETYAKGMANYADLDIRVLPPSDEDKATGGRVHVIQEVTGPDGTNRVAYTMALDSRTSEWKLINMVLNGVNLGKTFRNQFAQAAKQHEGDLEAVINNWSAEA